MPTLVYRAEAYEEGDRFREPIWSCGHEHESVELAYNCGIGWLYEKPEAEESA